ncbi:hypothetical protein D1872_271920 [compost metagenome]
MVCRKEEKTRGLDHEQELQERRYIQENRPQKALGHAFAAKHLQQQCREIIPNQRTGQPPVANRRQFRHDMPHAPQGRANHRVGDRRNDQGAYDHRERNQPYR